MTHQVVPKLYSAIQALNREFGNNLMCHPVNSFSCRRPKRGEEEEKARSRPPVGFSRWQRQWRPPRWWQEGRDSKGPEGKAASARERTRSSEKWFVRSVILNECLGCNKKSRIC